MKTRRRRPETPESQTSPRRRPSTQPASRDARRRRALGRPLLVDALEERMLLAAAVTISGADALAFVANTTSTVHVSYATGVYTISDNAEVINVTNNGTGTVTGNGTNTITVTNTTSLDFDLNGTSSSAILDSTGNQPVLLHDTTGGGDFFQIGSGGSAQGVLGPVTIGSSTSASTSAVDNQTDPTGRTVTVSSSSVTGLTPSTIDVTNANLSNLSLFMGTGVDTTTVTGTHSPTTLQGNTLGDTVNVQGTNAGASLTVGGTTGETINIGNAGSVQGILGTVTVSNNNNGSTITVDDSADSTARTVSVGSVTMSGLAPAAINFLGSEPTTIKGGTGGNTFTFTGTPGNPTTLDSGTGNDTVNVQATDAGRPVTIHGQGGSDAVSVGSAGNLLSTIGSSITIDNTSGSTALSINDSGNAGAVTATLSGTQLTGASPGAINFANLSSLSALFGSAADTVDVTGTPAGATTTLTMGSSTSNAVNLGDATHAASGLGDVTVTGTTGLTIDDTADASAQTVAVDGSSLTIGASPVFDYSGATLQGLTFDGGSGATAVTVSGTPTGVTPVLSMGSSTSNAVIIGDATHAAASVGPVTINGTTALEIDDSADATARTVTVDGSSLTIDASPVFDYSGFTLAGLTFDGGTAANTVDVTGTPAGVATTLAMGASTSNAVNLGDATHAASGLGDVTVTGTTGLTIDDMADGTAQTVAVTGSGLTIGSGPAFDYSGATLQGLEFDGGTGATTVTVTGTPTGVTPTLAMGSSTSNAVNLGDATHAASSLGHVTITGTTALTVDDSADGTGQTTVINGSSVEIGFSSLFDYSGATLEGFTFDGGTAANTVDVIGTPAGVATTVAMGASTSNVVNLGDATHVASSLGDVTVTGTTALTVDDSADLSGQTVAVKGSDLKIGSAPDFTYSLASLVGLVVDASDAGSNTVNVSSTPALSGATPLTLNMGTGTGNLVDFGSRADSYGDTTITTGVGGTTGLTIDDSSGNGGWTIGVTASTTTFTGGPTYDYSGATLSSMTLNLDNDGGNTVNVTGTPTLPSVSPLSISAFTGTGDAINLGDATHAASSLGSVELSSGGGGPLDVTIDDSADAAGETIDVTSTAVTVGVGGPVFGLSSATLNSLTIDTSDLGGTTVNVTGTQAAPNPLTLSLGTGGTNTINLGDPTHAAGALGDITVSSAGSANDLVIDDSADGTAGSVDITASSLVIGAGPVFNYLDADLSALTFDGAGTAATTVNVTGTPASALLTLNMGSALFNMVNLGDPSASPPVAASSLGDITVTGHAGLNIDDSADATDRIYTVTSSSLSIGSGPVFDYSGATLGVLWFYGGTGSDTMNVTSVPVAGLTPSLYMGGATSSVANIGDPTHPASTIGNVFIASEAGAPIAVTIDDSGGASGPTVSLDGSSLTFDPTHVITYSGVTFTSLAFDASNAGSTTVDFTASPSAASGLAPITLGMGTGTSNSVALGSAADSLGDVTVTTGVGGSTGLSIDDSTGTAATTIGVTSMTTTFTGGPTFNYCGATLTSMSLTTSGVAGNTVNVTGTPSLMAPNTLSIATTANGPATVNLGDGSNAASNLGSISFADSSTAPITLFVDDAGGDGSTVISIDGSSLSFNGGPTFDYAGDYLSDFDFDAANAGNNTVNVTGSPMAVSGLSRTTLQMGSGSGNAVNLGDATHAASALGNVGLTNGTPGLIALTVDDSADTSGQNVTMTSSDLTFGTSGPDFNYDPIAVTLSGLTFDGGSGATTVTVRGTPTGVTPTLAMGSSTSNVVNLGDATHAASGLGDVTVTGTTGLTIDDTADGTAQTVAVTGSGLTIGSGPAFDYSGATLQGLGFDGGTGADTVDVTGTPAGVTTTLAMGSSTSNAVNLGDATHAASSLGAVTVTGTTGLTIDDSADAISRSELLQSDGSGLALLSGLAPSNLGYQSSTVTHVTLEQGSGASNTLTVDFSSGNPLPAGATTSFDFDATLGSSNTLVLQGELPGSTPFDSEVYSPTANNTGAGVITLRSGAATSILNFGGLTPIIDTTNAMSFTFISPSNAQVVTITNGTLGALTTDTIASGDMPSAFESVTFANKADVLVDLSAETNPSYVTPPPLPATGLNNLTIKYFGDNTSGHTLTVTGTTPGTVNTITLGGYDNTLIVQGVTATGPLVIDNEPAASGANTVEIGDSGSLANILDSVTIDGSDRSTYVSVDGSADASSLGSMLLEMDGVDVLADLTGVLPGGMLAYDPAAINSFGLSTGSGSDALTVDFVNGNPFFGQGATSPYTFDLDAGGGSDNSLAFQDTSGSPTPIFVSENYTPTDPHGGVVSFYNGATPVYQGGVQFSNLTPMSDSTPVTNYTFTPPSSGGTIAVTDDPTAGYTLISDPSPSPSFESVAYTNKTNVTIDAKSVLGSNLLVLNNPTAATGQATLTVDFGSASDTGIVSANPAGVDTTLNGGVGSQAITVNGAGLATGTTSSNLAILGGAGLNTLRLNSQGTGSTATLTPGTPGSPAVANFATGTSLAFINFGVIQDFATNHAPVFQSATTATAQAGVPLMNIPVATFTDADLIENAGSYQATINWGDGTAPSVGTITAVTGTPGEYLISGSHTYLTTGNMTISVTLTDMGGTFNSTLNNAGGAVVPVSTQLDALAGISGNTDTVSVAQLQLGSTTAMAATAGTSQTGTLAVFTNTNGSNSAGDYYAWINWGDGSAATVATIAAHTGGGFEISGTHTFAAPGTYLGTIELHSAMGQSLSIPLTANVQAPTVTVTTGLTGKDHVPTGDLTVATVSVPFFLGSPGLDYHGYIASVDYGDGSPAVPATLAPVSIPGATAFSVETSGHVYATPGTYTLSVAIRDGAGVIVGTGSAAVVINDPPPPTPPVPGISGGRLSPQSDSGVSDSDGITRVTTPTFVGNASPGAVIQVFETFAGSSAAPVLIASGVANDSGAWSATVVDAPLSDGAYQITATATTGSGGASMSLGTVVVDTVAPVITNVVFRRQRGEMDFYFQDNLSGVFLSDLSNGANYQVSAKPLNGQIPVPKVIIPTSVAVTPGASPVAVDEAVVRFNHGKPLRGGHYTIQVLGTGITDIAGNMLNGRFYGSYPSGSTNPGGNYQAQFTAFPAKVLGAFPIKTGYAKPKPIPSVRSMARVEAITSSPAVHRTRAQAAVGQPVPRDAQAIDWAIASLAGTDRKPR